VSGSISLCLVPPTYNGSWKWECYVFNDLIVFNVLADGNQTNWYTYRPIQYIYLPPHLLTLCFKNAALPLKTIGNTLASGKKNTWWTHGLKDYRNSMSTQPQQLSQLVILWEEDELLLHKTEQMYYLCSLSDSAKIQYLPCLFMFYCYWGCGRRKWKRKGQIWSDAKALFQWSKRAVTEFYTCKGVRAYMGIRYASRWLHFFTFIRLSPHSFDDSPIVSFYTRPDICHNDKNAHSQTPSRPPTYGFTTTI